MKLLVGLGTPGNNYSSNRHNIGFRLVDYLHEKCAFPLWTNSTNYQYSKGLIADEQVILIKPSTFMNESGKGVLSASKFFKINCKDDRVYKRLLCTDQRKHYLLIVREHGTQWFPGKT